ncbi:MAG: hypothetical protein ACLP7Q_02740 [Isosphaeraceae bacterium]
MTTPTGAMIGHHRPLEMAKAGYDVTRLRPERRTRVVRCQA